MDAVEYVKTRYRLCGSKDSCSECPLQDKENCCCITDTIEYVEKAVQIVEEWAKDNPVKTRQSEFLKLFPNAQKLDGIINICPILIDEGYKSTSECLGTRCNVCRQLFWNEEVTDND